VKRPSATSHRGARGVADWGEPLPRAFYARDVVQVARAHDRVLAGRIVEVEAYRGADDPASHAFRGPTPRTRVMFGAPGHAYVYFTYGMHHCLNVVAERDGVAGAVLLRAAEPVSGADVMAERRGGVPRVRLMRGPGCLAQALGLTRLHSGVDLTADALWISNLPPRRRGRRIASGPRIGIRLAADRPWRFFLAGDPCVSGTASANRHAFEVDTPRTHS
jgi:DNA-3-methyladenine glycosylase